MRGAFWFPLRVGSALWLIDAAMLLSDKPPVHWPPTLLGLFGGLFVTLCLSAVAGLLLACTRWLALSPACARAAAAPPTARARLQAWLGTLDAAEQLARSGVLIALPGLLLVYALGSATLGMRLIVGMARPQFAALALLALHLLLSALALALLPAFASLGSWVALALGKLPGLGQALFGRPLCFAIWLGVLGAAAALGFVYVYREPLGYLPLHELGELAGACVFAGLYTLAVPHLPRSLLLVPRTLALCAALAAGFAAFTLSPNQMFARHIAEQSLLSGRLSHAALMLAFDVDDDGYLPMFGGGDCAPFDPAKNPGAIDIPGNHIDEDCDGSDLDPKSLPRMGIYDRPVPASVPKRPPVIFITIDAFAAGRMKAFGQKRVVTPNLDAFANRSALFTKCFAQGPSTRLSFPSIFTSRWDTQIKSKLIGKHPYPIDGSEQLMAELMRNAGYDTSAVLSDAYFARSRWTGLASGFSHVIETPAFERPALAHNGARVTDAAVAELSREESKPRFLWVHFYDAHSPHTQPEGVPVFGTTRQDVYDAELSYVDREVGRLLEEIDRIFGGQALVVITGDHGIAFDAPRHEKFNYGYDLSTIVLNVPLIVHAPFIEPRRLGGLVSTMDVLPTLVNLLRIRGKFPFEGVSLVPELFTGKSERPALLMHQMFLEERLWKTEEPLERVSLRTARWNLIHDRKGSFFELYDWQHDYLEQHDLSADPGYENVLRDLRQELLLFVYMKRPKSAPPAPPALKPAPAAVPAPSHPEDEP